MHRIHLSACPGFTYRHAQDSFIDMPSVHLSTCAGFIYRYVPEADDALPDGPHGEPRSDVLDEVNHTAGVHDRREVRGDTARGV